LHVATDQYNPSYRYCRWGILACRDKQGKRALSFAANGCSAYANAEMKEIPAGTLDCPDYPDYIRGSELTCSHTK
jgi:hypothetical protein